LRRSRTRRSRRGEAERRRAGKSRPVERWVRVVGRGPGRCALCGGRIERPDDRVALGDNLSYAHMKCAVRYSFSVLRRVEGLGGCGDAHEGAGVASPGMVKNATMEKIVARRPIMRAIARGQKRARSGANAA
jgi:hypothetical protein